LILAIFHPIANAGRRDHLAQVRERLKVAPTQEPKDVMAEVPEQEIQPTFVCQKCGAVMNIVEILARKPLIRAPPSAGRCAMSCFIGKSR